MRVRALVGALVTVSLLTGLEMAVPTVAHAATTVDLLADQNVDVGDVTISNDSANLFVTLTPGTGVCLKQDHVAVAASASQLPQTKSGNAIPGKFPYGRTFKTLCPSSDSFTVPLASLAGYIPGASVYIAVHAEVTLPGSTALTTAWANGYGFPGANWSTYMGAALTPEVLTFDEFPLAAGAEQPIPNGYGGFDWNEAGVFRPNPPAQYGGYAVKSSPNLGFIAEAGGFEIDGYPSPAGTPSTATAPDFSFVGAWFSAVYRDGLVVTITAFDDGVLVGQKAVTVNTFGPTWVFVDDANDGQRFESIDRIAFSADDHDGTTWDYFGFDDFTYFPAVS
jgi:hypothetical protein